MEKRLLRKRVVCFCLLVFVHGAQATESDRPRGLPAGTIMVCQTEQAIGFRWVRGKWKSTDFIADSYTVEKRDVFRAVGGNAGCRGMSIRVDALSGNEDSMPGCYAIHRRGQDSREVREQICTESMAREGGKWLVRKISCERFTFNPNGWFHRTSLPGDLADKPLGGEKDPLSVAVGHCHTVQ